MRCARQVAMNLQLCASDETVTPAGKPVFVIDQCLGAADLMPPSTSVAIPARSAIARGTEDFHPPKWPGYFSRRRGTNWKPGAAKRVTAPAASTSKRRGRMTALEPPGMTYPARLVVNSSAPRQGLAAFRAGS